MERDKIKMSKNITIPTELIRKIAISHFTVSEIKIFLLLVALTFGADRKEFVEMRYIDFADILQSSRQQIINSFKSLEKQGLIKNYKSPGELSNTPNKWGINKEYFGVK